MIRDPQEIVDGLLDHLPVAVYTCEAASGRITSCNAEAVRVWGREPRTGGEGERFSGALRVWHPDGTVMSSEDTPMARTLATGTASRGEEVVVERPDGSRVAMLMHVDPVLDADGRVTSAVAVLLDAASLTQVAQTSARLAAIVESSDDAIIGKDLDGLITSWNLGAERMFGYTAAEAVGQPVTLLIPADRQNEEPDILDRIRHGDRIDHYETVRRHKDGSLREISLSVSPVRDRFGRVVGASKIARDITERKQNELRLALDQNATLRLAEIGNCCSRSGSDFSENLSRMLDAAIWITNADKGNVQLVDEDTGALVIAAHRGFDGSFVEFFGRIVRGEASACGVALDRHDRVIVEDITKSDIFDGQPSRDVLLTAGVRSMQSTPLIGSDGRVVGMLSTHVSRPQRPSDRACRLLDVLARQAADYIERKRGEEQREVLLQAAQRARADAEAANRAKDEFLAMLGHELRNPLSAVRNAIAAARLDPASRGQALEIARRQTDQLGRIVDDLLDIARIIRGRVPLRRERVAVRELIQRAVDSARPLIEARGHTLNVQFPPADLALDADAARIQQILGNLLSNAAKYTALGGAIDVTAERDGLVAVIRVRDNGPGIPADVLPTVFELFTQGERTLDRSQGGLGIGLTLVRRIVELHGGSVEAKNAPGRGAEFVVRLPALPASDSIEEVLPVSASATTPALRRPAHVLLVEDNPDAAESLAMLLELLGHRLEVVHDGIAAIRAARADVPDVMLIDIGLPGMSGYEVAEAVRRDDALRQVTLVALTGYGRPEDRAQAMAAGFDYHLVKPVDLEALGDLVAHPGPPAHRSQSLH